ncbi:MAG: hypothetical protein GX130_08660 [Candidatus Hydrogenedens sp.]|jgi:hypothetical protein|nr:hypothetical protein [Candidatus Hydrogenedens sp.]
MLRKEDIYITDTSVLYSALRGEAGFKPIGSEEDDIHKQVQNFCQYLLNGDYRVVIPFHAFLEFSAQFFQTNIDHENYERWYQSRKFIFKARLLHPILSASNITLQKEIPRGSRIPNRVLEPIHNLYLREIPRKGARTSFVHPSDPKFLDGMDGAIFEEAILVAEQNPETTCFLVSTDRMLVTAAKLLRHTVPGSQRHRNLKSMNPWGMVRKLQRQRYR